MPAAGTIARISENTTILKSWDGQCFTLPPHETFLIFMLEKKYINDVEFDFRMGCILLNFSILGIENEIYKYTIIHPHANLKFFNYVLYISQMVKHVKFQLYLTIITTETFISTRNLMKMTGLFHY